MDIEEEINYCLNCKTKPCTKGCPLENDIPEVIRLIKNKEFEEAYKTLTKTTVLPAACGRICPHMKQCQSKCTRGIKQEPVQIGSIEAYLADIAIENKYKIEKFECYEENKAKNKKVAVIGGGPAGLTCAAFLARSGINVTIYEKHNKLGGILEHGIPEFRLEKRKVEQVINNILDLGINVEYNKEIGKNLNLLELVKEYDAIFLGIGANVSTKMNIEGEALNGVYGANEVLEFNKELNIEGKKVAIIGGGNVAMDIARTAKRKNALEVTVIYRRERDQMPAELKEIEEAENEGIKFLFKNNITKIISDENKEEVKKIECIKTELIQKDGESRPSPVNIEGSNYQIDMDMVFMAVGSKPEKEIIDILGLNINKYGNIEVDNEYRTSNKKIFAAGDLIGEKATVAFAARSGRNAANSILKNILSSSMMNAKELILR